MVSKAATKGGEGRWYADGGFTGGNGAVEIASVSGANSKAVELADVNPPDYGGPGGKPGLSITFAPQITIQGNADRKTVDEALEELEQRFEVWLEANFERLYNGDIGRMAADMLLERIKNPDLPFRSTYVKTMPVWRNSTLR